MNLLMCSMKLLYQSHYLASSSVMISVGEDGMS